MLYNHCFQNSSDRDGTLTIPVGPREKYPWREARGWLDWLAFYSVLFFSWWICFELLGLRGCGVRGNEINFWKPHMKGSLMPSWAHLTYAEGLNGVRAGGLYRHFQKRQHCWGAACPVSRPSSINMHTLLFTVSLHKSGIISFWSA